MKSEAIQLQKQASAVLRRTGLSGGGRGSQRPSAARVPAAEWWRPEAVRHTESSSQAG